MEEFGHLVEGVTVGDMYTTAIDIAKTGDKEKAKRYFDALVNYIYNTDKTQDLEECKKIIHSNIGYWAGYFEHGMLEKVHEVYGSSHPIFGTTTPTASEAFKMGVEYGKNK